MKLFLSMVLVTLNFGVNAFVADCETKTQLDCSVNYYKSINDEISQESVESSSHFELQNWDEPSLSYCSASVSFNKNDLYIQADLNEENLISISMTRNSAGGKSNDYFQTSGNVDALGNFKASLSLSPSTISSVYGLDVNCKILK